MKEGFYEQIITQSLQRQLSSLQDEVQQRTSFGKADGPMVIGRFFQGIIQQAFQQIAEERDELAKAKMIDLANALIKLISDKLNDADFLTDLIDPKGELLKGFFKKAYFNHADVDGFLPRSFPLPVYRNRNCLPAVSSVLVSKANCAKRCLQPTRCGGWFRSSNSKGYACSTRYCKNCRKKVKRFVLFARYTWAPPM